MKEDFLGHEMPMVSVIMPAFNCQAFIGFAIDSILDQSHKRLELVIVLDGGSDNTEKIVTKYCSSDNRIKKIEHPTNMGVATARNSGLKVAVGDFIAFCDSDDVWLPDKLEQQLKTMYHENAPVVHSSAILIDSNGEVLGNRLSPKIITNSMMQYRNFVINSSSLIRRSEFPDLYQKPIPHEDYDMWLRLFARQGVYSVRSDEALVKYRVHNDNLTKNKVISIWWMLRVQRMNGIKIVDQMFGLFRNIVSRIFQYLRGK